MILKLIFFLIEMKAMYNIGSNIIEYTNNEPITGVKTISVYEGSCVLKIREFIFEVKKNETKMIENATNRNPSERR